MVVPKAGGGGREGTEGEDGDGPIVPLGDVAGRRWLGVADQRRPHRSEPLGDGRIGGFGGVEDGGERDIAAIESVPQHGAGPSGGVGVGGTGHGDEFGQVEVRSLEGQGQGYRVVQPEVGFDDDPG
jgi:hypothetical protein